MDSPVTGFAKTAAERIAELEQQQALWRRVFLPLESHYFGYEVPWLVQDWIPVGTLVILASPPKQGKTALATALALAVATGTPFAGMPCTQGGVLWLSQEESMFDRQRLLELSPHVDPLTPLFTTYDHLPIDRQETIDVLSFWVQETSAKLIVVDPLHGATSGRSLTDGWSARKTLDPLRQLCHTHSVTALVLHHSKRAAYQLGRQRVAESDQLAATSGMNIVLSTRLLPSSPRPSEGEGLGVRVPLPPLAPRSGGVEEGARGRFRSPDTLTPTRIVTLDCTGRGPFANRTLHLLSDGPLHYALQDELPEGEPMARSRVTNAVQISRLLKDSGPLSSAAIIAHLDLPDNSVRVALYRLVRDGRVRFEVGENKERIYHLDRPTGSTEAP
ncbi:MAG: AAA family ATPase [Armatimonadetes bacterium]|nr:AAA family ATPase [Armatimonadota bacterium]